MSYECTGRAVPVSATRGGNHHNGKPSNRKAEIVELVKQMLREGMKPVKVACLLDLTIGQVTSIKNDCLPDFKYKPHKCKECGCEVLTVPCVACTVKAELRLMMKGE